MIEAIRRRQASDERGFTLVELLVVVAILGVLVGIVVLAVAGLSDNANETACDADVKQLQTAVEAYNSENGSYPADEAALQGNLVPAFMDALPDPADFSYAGGDVTNTCT